MGVLVQNLATFVAGYAIAFSAGWKMTLVITATLPLLMFSAWTEAKFMQGFSDEVPALLLSLPLPVQDLPGGKQFLCQVSIYMNSVLLGNQHQEVNVQHKRAEEPTPVSSGHQIASQCTIDTTKMQASTMYDSANQMASETFGACRTVAAFNLR